jgi:hypothetical protein
MLECEVVGQINSDSSARFFQITNVHSSDSYRVPRRKKASPKRPMICGWALRGCQLLRFVFRSSA